MKTKLMKKLTLAAAVACASVGAKAEALYWTLDGVVSTDDQPMSDSNPYTTYFIVISLQADGGREVPRPTHHAPAPGSKR